jgi:ribose transport system permease protein
MDSSSSDPVASVDRPAGLQGLALSLRILKAGPILILIAMIIAAGLLSPYFLTPRNIGNVLAQTAVIAMLSMGQFIVILTRGIDLSVGSCVALCSVVGAAIFRDAGSGTTVVLAMLATGALVGAVNGLVYVYGRLPHPFIITLATLSICKGLAFEISDGQTISGMPGIVRLIGHDSLGWFPVSAFAVGIVALLLAGSRRLIWGRWVHAVGGNPEAAVRSGIPVRGVLVSVYVLSGVTAALGAIIVAGRTNAGSGLLGDLGELDSIAAVIIGGASFLGGRGHIGQALIGALMIGVLRNGLNLMNVSIFYQLIVIGVVIVIAVEADVLRAHLENRFRVLQAGRAA